MSFQILIVSLTHSPIPQIVTRGTSLSRIATALQVLTIASLGSTSFIEEEHQTVYFLTSTALLLIPIAAMRKPRQTVIMGSAVPTVLALLGAFRVAKKFNQGSRIQTFEGEGFLSADKLLKICLTKIEIQERDVSLHVTFF